jgi:hypothetical protein
MEERIVFATNDARTACYLHKRTESEPTTYCIQMLVSVWRKDDGHTLHPMNFAYHGKLFIIKNEILSFAAT